MSDLLGKPEDRFSHNEAHFFLCFQRFALHGVVDDFNVRLKYADRSQGNNPSIYVFDQNGGNGVKIVYQTLDNELKELLSESSGL